VLLMVHSWLTQACTEMVMPMSYSENRSMYPPYKFDYASYAENCIKSYGVRPRPRWITTEFGGHNITTVLEKFGSNIIFFNGLLDPWSGGGVLKNISESVIAIVAPLGAVLSSLYLQYVYAIHLYLVLMTQNSIDQCLYLMQSDIAS
jgi:hypothetical protein